MKKYFIERTLDIFLVEFIVSALAASMYFTGLFKNYFIVFLTSLAATFIYLGWTVYCLFTFRMYIKGKKYFYFFNLPLYGILFISAIVTGIFETEPYYTFLFMPFKLFYYARKVWSFPGAGHIDRPVSAAVMSAAILAIVIIIPNIINSHRKKKLSANNEF